MKNIIVLCDATETDRLLIVQAEKLATAFNSQIYLLHIAAPDPDFVSYEVGPQHERDWRASTLKCERNLLRENAKKIQDAGIAAKTVFMQGIAINKIMDEVKLLMPDLVVLGNHQHGIFYRTLIGNTSGKIVNKLNCPVLLVPLQ